MGGEIMDVQLDAKQPVKQSAQSTAARLQLGGGGAKVQTDDGIEGVEQTFIVTIPGDGNPIGVHMNLWRDHYDATDADAKQLIAMLQPTLKHDKSTADFTAKELVDLAASNNGVISLHITKKYDHDIKKALRDLHGGADAEQVQGIIDSLNPPELRAVFGPLLLAIANGTRSARLGAAFQLQKLAGKLDPASAKSVREVIDGLQVNGKQDDQVLSLVRVQLQLEEAPVSVDLLPKAPTNPLDLSLDRRTNGQKQADDQVAKAKQKIAAIQKQIDDKQAAGNFDRKEGAALYLMIAQLRGLTGESAEAQVDLNRARQYQTNQLERSDATKQAKRGGATNLRRNYIQGQPDQMSAPSETQKKLDENKEAFDRENEDAEANEAATKLPESDDESKFYAPTQLPMRALEKQSEAEEAKMGGGGPLLAAILLFKDALEWFAWFSRVDRVSKLQDERRELQKQQQREEFVRMPPPPEKILEAIKTLRAERPKDAKTAADYEKKAVMLEKILVDARIAWDRSK